jgi:hypothetical protein
MTLYPLYEGCVVTGTATKVTIDTNGCNFTFTVTPSGKTEQTVHLVCPVGQKLVVTRPGCTISIPPQTITSGVTYTQITENNVHALTMDINSQLALQYEAGECTALGTNQTGTLKGSLVLRAYSTIGQPTPITATSPETLGHFYSSAEHSTIAGSEAGEHRLHLSAHSLAGEIGCGKTTYQTTRVSKAFQEIAITPVLETCTTTGGGAVTVGVNECQIVLHVAHNTGNETEQKADLACPAGKFIGVATENCWLVIRPQSNIGKITYTTIEESGKHAITADVNAEISVQRELGPCTMLGTNGTGTLKGSITIKAFNTGGGQESLTAT